MKDELKAQHYEQILDRDVVLEDITMAVRAMPDRQSFLDPDPELAVRPAYADRMDALYLLMKWPWIPSLPDPLNKDQQITPDSQTEDASGLSLYGALMPHGKTHVVEIFFVEDASGRYLGSHKVFSVKFPEGKYMNDYDDWLMEELATKTLGVKREKSLGQQFYI